MAVIRDIKSDVSGDDLMFGLPTREVVYEMQNKVNQFMNMVGNVGSKVINIGMNTFRDIGSMKALIL